MIDVLGCGDARENVTQTVTFVEVDRYDGDSSWSGPRCP